MLLEYCSWPTCRSIFDESCNCPVLLSRVLEYSSWPVVFCNWLVCCCHSPLRSCSWAIFFSWRRQLAVWKVWVAVFQVYVVLAPSKIGRGDMAYFDPTGR